jgi:hypothetical protein
MHTRIWAPWALLIKTLFDFKNSQRKELSINTVIHWLIIFTFDASLGANFCGEIHDLSDLV